MKKVIFAIFAIGALAFGIVGSNIHSTVTAFDVPNYPGHPIQPPV
jgi:hypothetical protein